MKTFPSIVLCLAVTFFINLTISSYGAEKICLTKNKSQLWRYVPEEEGIKEACFIPLPFVPEEYLCGEDIIVLSAKATISVISKALSRRGEETVVIDSTKYAAKVFAKTLPDKAGRLGDPFHHIPK